MIRSVLDDMGFEMVDVEYLSERGRWVLRVYVDKPGGVSVEDCARVSREISDLLDVKDVVPQEYTLEVSSPGVDRPLKKEKDLLDALGKKVKVKMANRVEGRRNFTGYLEDYREGVLLLNIENGRVSLPWPDVQKANLIGEFEI